MRVKLDLLVIKSDINIKIYIQRLSAAETFDCQKAVISTDVNRFSIQQTPPTR